VTEKSKIPKNSNETKVISKTQKKKRVEVISYEQEILRKGVHLMSLSIPVGYIFVSRELALYVLIPMMLIALSIDLLSKYDNFVRKYLYLYFGRMLRHHEKNNDPLILNGASWVLISAVITLLFFPKVIAVISFMVLIVCDISAALIGRRFGKHKIFDKSIEGTFAFIVSGFIITWIVGTIYRADIWFFIAGYLGSFFGGIVELYSTKLKVDDNLAIPISVGITMSIVNSFAYYYFDKEFLDLFQVHF